MGAASLTRENANGQIVMPELPEVEIARRNVARWMAGQRVLRARAAPSRIFRGAELAAFESISGALRSLERRGKYLLFRFERDQGLLAHLGMTGKFVRRPTGEEVRFSRAHFELSDRFSVHLADSRMFGRIEPVRASALRDLTVVRALGLDPLADGLTPERLARAVGKTSLGIKVALMDQARVAGLGNIHAAEALFRAGIHPARKPASLSPAEWRTLSRAILDALVFALENQQGEEIQYVEEVGAGNVFHVYGHGDEPCPACSAPIQSFAQGGRTTYFCPRCQPAGKGKR